MGRVEIRAVGGNLVAVRKIGRKEQVSSVEWDILAKGEIPALAVPQVNSSLFHLELCCPVHRAACFAELLQRGISFSDFCYWIGRIIETVQQCEAHGIRVGNLELQAAWVFCGEQAGTFQMLYWPLLSSTDAEDIRTAFFEYGRLLRCRQQEAPMKEAYLSYFQTRTRFDLQRFASFVSSLQSGRVQEKHLMSSGTLAGFSPALYDLERKQKIQLQHFPFVIGREKSGAQYVIEGDAQISRAHFAIHMQGDRFCLLDKSTNGTFLNGERLSPNSITELKPGDCIRAGKREFLFSLT